MLNRASKVPSNPENQSQLKGLTWRPRIEGLMRLSMTNFDLLVYQQTAL